MDIHASLKKQHVRAEEMFHGVAEIGKRLNEGFKISQLYSKYPSPNPDTKGSDFLWHRRGIRRF